MRSVKFLTNEKMTAEYGTSMGHIASQKVALGAGFIPAWAELVTDKITN